MNSTLEKVTIPRTARWVGLDRLIASWWDGDLHTATEEDVKNDPEQTLLFLPHPYVTPGGSESAFPEIYGWDTYYVNCALLAHGRADLARLNILNQLYQIETFGMTLNGNRTWYLTRSQPPLWAEGIARYFAATNDLALLEYAYPLLSREYEGYWCAPHHQTPTGLATNRDIGDTDAPRLHAESETGLDFFSGWDGEVRNCNPLITNCILVNFTRNLSRMAATLNLESDAARWSEQTGIRAARIRELCWDPGEEFFFEYDFVKGRRIPVWSLNAYWAAWAGIADEAQTAALVAHLPRFLHRGGLVMTDRDTPSPHPEFEWLQWTYPAGWPPFQVMVAETLERGGFHDEAASVANAFLGLQMEWFDKTGKLWEKYNVVDGSLNFPVERYPVPAMHGWSAASVVLLGRILDLHVASTCSDL